MSSSRRLISEAVIAAGACAAAAITLLVPADQKLDEARTRSLALRDAAERANQARDAIQAIQARLERAETTIRRLEDEGRAARDVTALYASLEKLATTHGVRIEEIDPSSTPQPRSSPRERVDPRLRRPGDAWVSLSLVVEGDLSSITAFVDAIEGSSNLARVEAFELMPAGRADLLTAQIRTVHGAIDLSPLSEAEVAALEGDAP